MKMPPDIQAQELQDAIDCFAWALDLHHSEIGNDPRQTIAEVRKAFPEWTGDLERAEFTANYRYFGPGGVYSAKQDEVSK